MVDAAEGAVVSVYPGVYQESVVVNRDVTVVAALPKTRSGKILRKTMRQIADNEEYTVPSTIEDASVLDELSKLLRG